MKNTKLFVMGMLALALVFGLALAGCDSPSNGGDGGGRIPTTVGKLTINNIPGTYNGKWVIALSRGSDGAPVIAGLTLTSATTGVAVQISGDTAVLPIYDFTSGSGASYSGSDTKNIRIYVLSSNTVDIAGIQAGAPENLIAWHSTGFTGVSLTFSSGLCTTTEGSNIITYTP